MTATRTATLLALLWPLIPPTALATAKYVLHGDGLEADNSVALVSLLQSSRELQKVSVRAREKSTFLEADRQGAALRVATTGDDGSTCGLSSSPPADCSKPDTGSCGNACCSLEVTLDMAPQVVYEAVADFLRSGGDNNSFSLVPGEMPFDEHPPDDISSLNVPGGWQYIFQGKHRTSGRGYVDTLNFNIRLTSSGKSILRAFSISDLHGALGDAGQNYKTLAFLLKVLGINPSEATTLYGCGAPITADSSPGPVLIAEATTASSTSLSKSTCGMTSGGGGPDCEKVDMGSCGNACCAVEVATKMDPKALYSAVARFLRSGGDTASFKLVPGEMPFGEHPPDDLTSLSLGDWKYVFQGQHTTSGRGYVDTLNLNIRSNGTSSVLRAFSASDVHGALGDAGQNFKTLAYILDATGIGRSGVKVLHGCGSS